jgi:hypothetical protein
MDPMTSEATTLQKEEIVREDEDIDPGGIDGTLIAWEACPKIARTISGATLRSRKGSPGLAMLTA